MNIYEVIFNEKTDKGVYALSVVEDPAMETMFIALNKDEPKPYEFKLAEINKEQRLLLGVALVPDKPIYRSQDGQEFYITFPAETIKAAAHSFLKNHNNNNSSIEHEVQLSGVSVVESWIVEDEKNDKSNVYGLNATKGSWVATMKVDNDELWNDFVKTGKIKGFSIDGLFSLNKLNINMSKEKSFADEIKEGFAELKNLFLSSTKVELAQAKLADGETVVEFEGDIIAEGTALFIVTEEGSAPAPDGDHEMEDGTVVTVTDGIVTAIKEKEAEAEAGADEMKELQEALTALGTELKAELSKLKIDLASKDEKIAALEVEKTVLETQLKSTPATKPIKHTSVTLSTDETKPTNTKERLALALKQNK